MTCRDWDSQFQRNQLHRAARDGDLPAIEKLLNAKYPTNRFDELGFTPLHYAVASGHLEATERLLRAGANVNAHDERVIGNTPLADNIEKCSLEMAEMLIDAGADPSIPGWMQLTAIHRAKRRRDADGDAILRLLCNAEKKKGGATASDRGKGHRSRENT